MAVYKRDMVDINLETGNIHRSFLKHSIGFKDAAADHFGIRVFRNGEPVNLTGVSVQGIFMPPQGDPIAITSGNIVSENEAEVVLPQACYNYDGQFTLAIKLVDPSNAVTGTMRIVDGMVDNTNASGTVAPTEAVPGYEEVLATYEQAIAAINKTVRFDAVQSLTDTQKATARSNISAASVADLQAETTAREAADTAINNAIGTVPSGKTVQGQIDTLESGKVPKTTTVNGHALSENVTVTKGDVGLGNVDNTSDANKPISTAQAAVNTQVSNIIGNTSLPTTAQTLTGAIAEHEGDLTNQQGQITDLKSAMRVDEYLINAGQFTIQKSDMESGGWSSGSKTVNATRGRSNMTYPVRSGMTVNYTNNSQTFDVYFGVYNENGITIQSIGWKTDKSGSISITKDGYMCFMIRDHATEGTANVDVNNYDCEVTIVTTEDKNIKNLQNSLNTAEKKIISLENTAGIVSGITGDYLLEYESGGIYATSGEGHSGGEEYIDPIHIRTAYIPVSGSAVIVTRSNNETINVYEYSSDEYPLPVPTSFIKVTGIVNDSQKITMDSNTHFIRLQLLKTLDNFIPGSVRVMVPDTGIETDIENIEEDIVELKDTDEENENNFCGVYEVKHQYLENTAFYYSADGVKERNTTRVSTVPHKIPKNGIYVYTDGEITYRITFIKLTDDGYVSADDYEYSFSDSAYSERNMMQEVCAYYPYEEGVLYSITTSNANDNENIKKVHVFAGKINRTGGRVPNITPCVVASDYNRKTFGIYPGYANAPGLSSFSRHYCCVVPVQYVDRVIAEPPYSLVAEIHKIDHDNKTEYVDENDPNSMQFARNPVIEYTRYYQFAFGKSVIDLTQCDFEGYAIIAIVPQMTPTITPTYKGVRCGFMGWGLKYEEVMNKVFVQWKNGVNVQIDSGIHSVAYSNIQKMFQIKVPEIKASQDGKGYSSIIGPGVYPFPNMGECSMAWYGGTNRANVPLMNVNPKSFITASKNRNSRMYDPIYIDYRTGSIGNSNLYGAVCSTTASLIMGLPAGNESYNYVFKLLDFCDYREYDGMTSIKPGDLFAGIDLNKKADDYGHILYVTEVVTINGNVFSVNFAEGWAAFLRRSMCINYEAYKGYTSGAGLFSFHGNSYFENFNQKMIARPHNSVYKSFRNAYGSFAYEEYQNYPVTEIMCDRGTDSVYCIGEKITLTVTDANYDSFDVYVDGTFNKTVTLAGADTTATDDDGNRVVTFNTGFVSASGFTELKVSNAVKESFFVPDVRSIEIPEMPATGTDDVNKYVIDNSETDDEIVAVEYAYSDHACSRYFVINEPNIIHSDTEITPESAGYKPYQLYETDGEVYIYIPNTKMLPSLSGVAAEITVVETIRRTPYGTYWVRVLFPVYEDPHGRGAHEVPVFEQRAGH